MGVIAIDYQVLSLIVVMMFALVGFFRGWVKEGLTTLLLVALVGFLYYPDAIKPLIDSLNEVIEIIGDVLKGLGILASSATATAASAATTPLASDNPYSAYMWLVIALIAISYLGSGFSVSEKRLSALSRILGGIGGALNGFIAITLFKEFALRYIQKLPLPAGQTASASAATAAQTAAAKGGIVVTLQNLPQQSFTSGIGPTLILLLGAGMLVVLLNQAAKNMSARSKAKK